MVIPSTPGPPLFCRTRFHALTRFSRLHTSSINCSVTAELSGAGFATNGSVRWGQIARGKYNQNEVACLDHAQQDAARLGVTSSGIPVPLVLHRLAQPLPIRIKGCSGFAPHSKDARPLIVDGEI